MVTHGDVDGLVRYLARTFVLLVLASACGVFGGIGDQTQDVFLVNAFAEPIDVYAFGRQPSYRLRVIGGQTVKQAWPLSANSPKAIWVEADNLQGVLIFCIDVTYADLTRLKWRLEVAPGHPKCA